ncbi:MAG: hypothetical protein IKX51_07205, partial [Bacteroidales bacterium]|nr:hypothetical protein [Bacteroidales bacterium]
MKKRESHATLFLWRHAVSLFLLLTFVSAQHVVAQDGNGNELAMAQCQQKATEQRLYNAQRMYGEDSVAMAKRIETLQKMLLEAQKRLNETQASSDSVAKMTQIIVKQQ